MAGLIMLYATSTGGIMQHPTRLWAEVCCQHHPPNPSSLSLFFFFLNIFLRTKQKKVDARFSSVERISNYIREVPNEREATAQPTLPAAWPAHGEIAIENLTVAIPPGAGPPRSTAFLLSIKAGEHVGIAWPHGSVLEANDNKIK
jgi:ABC-type multidrug transport system fused ATPase/permease subunit